MESTLRHESPGFYARLRKPRWLCASTWADRHRARCRGQVCPRTGAGSLSSPPTVLSGDPLATPVIQRRRCSTDPVPWVARAPSRTTRHRDRDPGVAPISALPRGHPCSPRGPLADCRCLSCPRSCRRLRSRPRRPHSHGGIGCGSAHKPFSRGFGFEHHGDKSGSHFTHAANGEYQ